MSNLKVSYDAIIDACAMLGVSRPVREIDLMLEGKMTMDGNVEKAIKTALEGGVNKFNLNPLRIVEMTTESQLEQVCELVTQGNSCKQQLLELSGLDDYILTQVLQRLRKSGKIHCAGNKGSFRWLVGAKPIKRSLMSEARDYAVKNGLKSYEGTAHEKCGTTTKYTQNGNCVLCHGIANKNRYIKIPKKVNPI